MGEVTLKINEIFYSIQGESSLAGKPTVFVRTAMCNLRCHWCDTRYAYWNGTVMSLDQILAKVAEHSPNYVCLTGGEPLVQQGSIALLNALLEKGYTVSLETSGSVSIKDVPSKVIKVVDIKCPESGESEKMAWENLDLVSKHDQLKFVINSKRDFEWSYHLVQERELEKKCEVLFSPVHGQVNPSDLAKWILNAQAPVTLQTQLHKELWGPDTKGV